jgi:hypothetical protein
MILSLFPKILPFKLNPRSIWWLFSRYIGGYGNQKSVLKISRDLGLGKGSIPNYLSKTITEILKLRSEYEFWPTPEERINIAEMIRKKFDIPNCAGIINGTLFLLESRPLISGEDYFTRKGFYGINWFHNMWRFWKDYGYSYWLAWSCARQLCLGEFNHLPEPRELFYAQRVPYLWFCIQGLVTHGHVLQETSTWWNTSKQDFFQQQNYQAPREIRTLHRVLTQLRSRIEGNNDTKRIIRLVIVICILHNLLIDEKIPDESYSPDGYDSEEASKSLDHNDELNLPVDTNSGDLCRTQLHNYLIVEGFR